MSSLPSSSGSLNGHNSHTNGTSHNEATPSVGSYDAAEHSPPSSSAPFPTNGTTHSPYQRHDEEIVNHLYHAGFQTGNYADTVLHVHQNVYRLHAIILSRSPFLAHLMSTSPQPTAPRTIYVHVDQEPEVTQEGFAIGKSAHHSMARADPASARVSLLVRLARSHPPRQRPCGARCGVPARGMDDLCQYAYDVCRRSIAVETIRGWLDFIDAIPPSPVDGSGTPLISATSVFGHYAQRLRDDVFHFLVVNLPQGLGMQDPAAEGRDVLLQVYSHVPFEMFKAAIETPMFQIGTDQARFKFAKDAIELRKRGIARGAGAEETVVLAFGGGSFDGMRKRPLWKVNS
ncbi:hypothetical protein BD779DRAFT_1467266 [Infundibulicybe gibba]|nr:hypothetical protein BD779DRAFT_1467266 [Infundibulicybe gibba]